MAATDELDLEFRGDGSVLVRWEELDKTGTPGMGEWVKDSKMEGKPWQAGSETPPF